VVYFLVFTGENMLKKITTFMMVVLTINFAFSGFVLAQDTESRATEKVKIKVAKFGVGDKLTEVKLKDKTKIKGYITEIKDDHFVVTGKKDRTSTSIMYSDVKSVGRPFTTLQKVLLIGGIAIAAYATIAVICVSKCGD
jgi:hypothetical protein